MIDPSNVDSQSCSETVLKKEIRMAVTYACTYVWEQTLNDMSGKGTLDRAIFPCVDRIITAISAETGRSF